MKIVYQVLTAMMSLSPISTFLHILYLIFPVKETSMAQIEDIQSPASTTILVLTTLYHLAVLKSTQTAKNMVPITLQMTIFFLNKTVAILFKILKLI